MTDQTLDADATGGTAPPIVGPDPSGGDGPAAPSSSSNRTRWTAVAVGLVLVALIGVLALGPGGDGNDPNALLGQRVPRVAGVTLDGGTYDIDDARGKWVIVNFFATWCPPCVQEHPELVALEQWGRSSGRAEVVSIVFNDPADEVRAFFRDNGGSWPVLDQPQIPIEFQVSQVPETFVISPRGLVVEHIEGTVDAAELIAGIEQAEAGTGTDGTGPAPTASSQGGA